jgi:hypothetical protein
MNHSDVFLARLLEYQHLSDTSTEVKSLTEEVNVLKQHLRDDLGIVDLIFREGGSKAKGTMVRCAYDYDLSIYSDSESTALGATLDEMATKVEKSLKNKYKVTEKTVAFQVKMNGKDGDGGRLGADVVIGRYVDGTRGDAFLAYHGSEKDRLKTNLEKHIQHVRDSGCTEIICLMKVWKVAQSLEEIKTFPLELATIKLLAEDGAPRSGLSQRLYWVLSRLADDAESIAIEDPANPSGNNIDRFFGAAERKLLRASATTAKSLVVKSGWEKLFAGINHGGGSSLAGKLAAGASQVSPIKPWSDSIK